MILSALALGATAAEIHGRALVIDTHADTPQRFLDEGFDLGEDAGTGHMDLAKIRAGNLAAEFFAIWIEPDTFKGHYVERADDLIDSVLEQVKRHPDDLVLATTADELVAARAGEHKRLAVLMGLEGGHAIDDDLAVLERMYRRGVRYMTLTHSKSNHWADSSGDASDAKVPHSNGLSPFGREVIATMNRLGMMVDVSHVSDATFWAVIETTKAPIIASHSSARALCNAARNLTDDQLRAVTKNGGVVQVNFFPLFIDETFMKAWKADDTARKAAQAALQRRTARDTPRERAKAELAFQREWGMKYPRPPVSVLVDHIVHVAEVAGIDHVGIGSDFDGISALPKGMDSVADLPKVTEELVARGYSEADIDKILGGNFLRVMREVERIAKAGSGGSAAAAAAAVAH